MSRLESHWQAYAEDKLVGRRIVFVRYMTDEEKLALQWACSPIVLVLDDGTIIYPSTDDEGNGAGSLFGQAENGEDLTFPVI